MQKGAHLPCRRGIVRVHAAPRTHVLALCPRHALAAEVAPVFGRTSAQRGREVLPKEPASSIDMVADEAEFNPFLWEPC